MLMLINPSQTGRGGGGAFLLRDFSSNLPGNNLLLLSFGS